MISVLLPARDAAASLDVALESLRAQTAPPAHVVVVDDGSVDSTPELLSRWQTRWQAIELARTGGIGIAGALNLGLERCLARANTKWIARMDADDRCQAARFERQLALASSDADLALIGTEVAHTGAVEKAEGMRRHIDWANSLHAHDELALALWIDSPLPHPTWLVRRDAFERVGRYSTQERVPEDYEWLHRLFAAARGARELRAGKCAGPPLVDWTESPGRLTRTSPAYAEDACNLVKARALAVLLGDRPACDVSVLGLGPKGKRLLSVLKSELGASVRRLVDVNPRRTGNIYEELEVLDIEGWKATLSGPPQLALICLGTPEAREGCERLCRSLGLEPFRDFISL